MKVQPSHQLRARFCGMLDWICPWCGHLNRYRVNRTTWRIRCKAKSCRRQFAIGMIFHSMGSIRRLGRSYLPPPDVTFPIAELDFWKAGGPVNRFVPEYEDEVEDRES